MGDRVKGFPVVQVNYIYTVAMVHAASPVFQNFQKVR